MHDEQRQGEVKLAFDPSKAPADAALVFIGRIRSAWNCREECPKNIARARASGITATLELDEPWRPGLEGLDKSKNIIVLYWMHQSRRDLIIQRPRHRTEATGVFALRSPVRPNPIALATVQVLAVDIPSGTVEIDAIDCLDGTPLLDIKPWLETVDLPASPNT